MNARRWVGFVLLVFGVACGGARHPAAAPPSPTSLPASLPATVFQTGTASWYGPGFNGKQTASGEIYDQNAMTAAHKTLPLGTRVRITRVATGQSVDVRINDRGPFVGNRIIDLSFAAAKAIDMVAAGTAEVRIQILDSPAARAAEASGPASVVRYTVQMGSFTNRDAAERLRAQAAGTAPDAAVVVGRVGETTYYRVQTGIFADRGAADAEAARILGAGFAAIVVER